MNIFPKYTNGARGANIIDLNEIITAGNIIRECKENIMKDGGWLHTEVKDMAKRNHIPNDIWRLIENSLFIHYKVSIYFFTTDENVKEDPIPIFYENINQFVNGYSGQIAKNVLNKDAFAMFERFVSHLMPIFASQPLISKEFIALTMNELCIDDGEIQVIIDEPRPDTLCYIVSTKLSKLNTGFNGFRFYIKHMEN